MNSSSGIPGLYLARWFILALIIGGVVCAVAQW